MDIRTPGEVKRRILVISLVPTKLLSGLCAVTVLLLSGCSGSARKFAGQSGAAAHLKTHQKAYEKLAREWRSERQRELCRESDRRFQWNDMSITRRFWGWKLQRASQTTGEEIDIQSMEEAAGVLGTTAARINSFLQQMKDLDVACVSNVGATLGDREGGYVQLQLAPYAEMYGFRYAPPDDPVATDGLRQWASQPPDMHGRRLAHTTGPWFYFEGLVQTSGLPLSSVSGLLRDLMGYPLRAVRLELALAREDGTVAWGQQAVTGKDGSFSFVQVPAGNYLLGLNVFPWMNPDAPFPRTFYPGVRTRQQAVPITLGEGKSLDIGQFRVPFKVTNRRVTAQVVWSDGKPEPDAEASLCWDDAEGRQCMDMRPIGNGSAHYEHIGADGLAYFVTARYRPRLKLLASRAVADPVRVPVLNSEGPVRLVLR